MQCRGEENNVSGGCAAGLAARVRSMARGMHGDTNGRRNDEGLFERHGLHTAERGDGEGMATVMLPGTINAGDQGYVGAVVSR